jgi:small subunit ribosomal protein S6e
VGSELDGNLIGLEGYKFLISGGSDDAGFPMRKDIDGSRKKKILAGKTIGVKKLNGARRIKKLVAGNLVYERTSQLNLKIIKVGKASLEEQTEEKTE